MNERKDISYIESHLEALKEFHGHLGPHVILGARMAIISNRLLGDDPFKKSVRVYCGLTRPKSCLIDGIQFFSGCTFGKANIEIIDEGILKAIFKFEELELTIKFRELDIPKATSREELETIAKEFLMTGEKELFEILLR